jgi:hypothetical protein
VLLPIAVDLLVRIAISHRSKCNSLVELLKKRPYEFIRLICSDVNSLIGFSTIFDSFRLM